MTVLPLLETKLETPLVCRSGAPTEKAATLGSPFPLSQTAAALWPLLLQFTATHKGHRGRQGGGLSWPPHKGRHMGGGGGVLVVAARVSIFPTHLVYNGSDRVRHQVGFKTH